MNFYNLIVRSLLTVFGALAFLTAVGLRAQSNYATPYAFAGLAGSSLGASGSTDGTGSAARFNGPFGAAVDSSGNVYVADTYNHTIRKITSGGVVTTLAGTAGSQGSTDGTGSAARFYFPRGVAVDGNGNVYVADHFNQTIRKITSGGVVTTLAGMTGGQGSTDGTGSAARFYGPAGVAVDGSGNVYVADSFNNTVRKITSGGVVTTLAGTAGSTGSADGTGSAARFYNPTGVAVDGNGNVYVADLSNSTIRKITSGGVVTTLAGNPGVPGLVNGTGSAARFNGPLGIAVSPSGQVVLADSGNHRITTAAPYLTTAATASGTVGVVFGGFTITANGLMGTYGATGLPGGLTVNPTTGVISGTPTAAGTYAVTLSATNVYGQTGTAALSLTVAPNIPPIANAGGPYTLTGGGSLVLNGASSHDQDLGDELVAYACDINNDGVFGDLTGAQPALLRSAFSLAAGNRTISLRVTDSKGAVNTATAVLSVVGGNDSHFSVYGASSGQGDKAANPYAGLVQASDGRFYGTTYYGGFYNAGTIFRINADGTGFFVLRSLNYQTDGGYPSAGLVQASDGKLYGTMTNGGSIGYGTIFSLAMDGSFTVLHSLEYTTDGGNPTAGLV